MRKKYAIILASIGLWVCPRVSIGQAAPDLGAAGSFALFSAVGAFNNVGPTVIQGDIGTNVGAFSGFPEGIVTGSINVANPLSTRAATAVQTAYGYMSTVTYRVVLPAYGGPIGTPQVLVPGTYTVGAATTLAGSLVLDGQGNPNALFFLQVFGALTTGAGSTVKLINGASLSNVYWQVRGAANLGHNSVMRGTVLVNGAVNLAAGASVLGRVLTRAGAISLDTNTAEASPVAPTPPATVWLGNGTTDWNTATNWSAGVPTSTVDATVPTATAPYPLIESIAGMARSLTIGSGAGLTMSGGSLDVKDDLTNSGSISTTGGSITLTGTTAQALGGSGSTQLWNLTIDNAAGATQAGALSIHGVLAPTSGTLATNGQPLTLLSDATATALVDNSGTGTVSGTATVQRYIAPATNAGPGYRHFSAPVSGSTVADLATAGFTPEVSQASSYNNSATPGTTTPYPTVFAYDQSRLATVVSDSPVFDKGFTVPTSLAAPLVVGQGYVVNIGAAQLINFVGQLTTGDQTLNLARSTSTSTNALDAGWQLVGNPYPSPLNYNLVAPADRVGLDAAIYMFVSTSQYVGNYQSYTNGIGNPVLPVGQAFFTRVSSGQTSASLTFRNSQRLTTPISTALQRTNTDPRPLVQLELRGPNGLPDALYVYAETGATAGFDTQYDALKLPNSTGLNLASTANTAQALAIDGLPAFNPATVLPLTVGVPGAGSYTLTAVALKNLPIGIDALLTDATTGQTVNLRQQSAYSFSISADQAAALVTDRFMLRFGVRAALAAGTTLTAADVTLYPNPAHGTFTVLLPAAAATTGVRAELLNSLGQVVRHQTAAPSATGASLAVDAAGLAGGVYTLRLRVGRTTVARRVVIQ